MLAAFLIVGLCSSCTAKKESNISQTAETTTVSTIVAETKTEVFETEKETEESQEEIAKIADPVSEDEDQYKIFMTFIDEYEGNNPGSNYQIVRKSFREEEGKYWALYIEGLDKCYAVLNGEITTLEPEDHPSEFMSYDRIKMIPYLPFETEYIDNDVYFTSEASDGRYFGEIMAVSVGGTKVLVRYGNPIIYTTREVECLRVGDVIRGTDLRVTTAFELGWIDVGDDYLFSGAYCDEGHLMLCDSNIAPYTINNRYTVIDISPECEVTGYFEGFVTEEQEADYDNMELSGVPLMDSLFWYLSSARAYEDPVTYEGNSGWLPYTAYAYPFEVQGGQIVSIDLEWR